MRAAHRRAISARSWPKRRANGAATSAECAWFLFRWSFARQRLRPSEARSLSLSACLRATRIRNCSFCRSTRSASRCNRWLATARCDASSAPSVHGSVEDAASSRFAGSRFSFCSSSLVSFIKVCPLSLLYQSELGLKSPPSAALPTPAKAPLIPTALRHLAAPLSLERAGDGLVKCDYSRCVLCRNTNKTESTCFNENVGIARITTAHYCLPCQHWRQAHPAERDQLPD